MVIPDSNKMEVRYTEGETEEFVSEEEMEDEQEEMQDEKLQQPGIRIASGSISDWFSSKDLKFVEQETPLEVP